jgi:hypothetical protein
MEPYVAASLDELVAGATDRVEVRTPDAKSGARFETLRIGGVPHFLKSLSVEDDWIMRVTGNDSSWELKVGGPACTPRRPTSSTTPSSAWPSRAAVRRPGSRS